MACSRANFAFTFMYVYVRMYVKVCRETILRVMTVSFHRLVAIFRINVQIHYICRKSSWIPEDGRDLRRNIAKKRNTSKFFRLLGYYGA